MGRTDCATDDVMGHHALVLEHESMFYMSLIQIKIMKGKNQASSSMPVAT
jgi:hypothetical protein